jgi:hypothetical protein
MFYEAEYACQTMIKDLAEPMGSFPSIIPSAFLETFITYK